MTRVTLIGCILVYEIDLLLGIPVFVSISWFVDESHTIQMFDDYVISYLM